MDASRFTFQIDIVPWIAVSIERTGDCTAHAGILYRDADNKLHQLHLGFHRQLRHNSCDPDAAVAIPLLDPADELFLSGFCGRIWRARQAKAIPFALKNNPDIVFDEKTGEVTLPPQTTGLNCATFVMAVFRSAGHDMVDPTGWPPARPDDLVARDNALRMMANGDSDRIAHGKVIASEMHTPRIRPEEVTGSCLEDQWPVGFTQCQPNGAYVRQQLNARFAPQP